MHLQAPPPAHRTSSTSGSSNRVHPLGNASTTSSSGGVQALPNGTAKAAGNGSAPKAANGGTAVNGGSSSSSESADDAGEEFAEAMRQVSPGAWLLCPCGVRRVCGYSSAFGTVAEGVCML